MRYLNHLIIFLLLLTGTVLSGCSAGGVAFSKAEQFEAEGNYEAAMFSYAESFRNDPHNGEARTRFFKARDAAAEKSFKIGMEQLQRAEYDAALAEFQTAYGLDSTQDRFKQKVADTTRLLYAQMAYRQGYDLEKANKLKDANRSYLAALELDPQNKEYQEASARVSGQRKSKLAGFELSLKSAKPITLKFKDAKIKDVFKIITQLTGINFIFDEAVKDQPISIYLENATFQQAMDLLTNMNKLHSLVLNESTVLIYPKTPEKSKQYEDMTLRTFHLSYMDAKKAVNLVRTMLQVKKIYVNEETNSLVVRDTSDIVAVVEKILDANDVPDPEVVLEVEVIELSSKNTQNVGLLLSDYSVKMGLFSPNNQLISSNGLTTSGIVATGTTSTGTSVGVTGSVAGIDNLLKVFTSKGYSGFMTVPNAQYNFGKTLAKGEVLSNPKLRVKNKEKAKFNVGQRVPITTTTSNAGTQTQVNVQYVDVGVKVNAEPVIQLNNEVVIKVSLEVSSIINKETVGGKDSATTVVTIGTKNLDTVLSLKDGETSVIGGLLQNTMNDSKQQIFLLGDIPLIGPLLSSNDKSKDKTELVLAITPRIVRTVTVPQQSLMSFTTGKEDDPSLQKPMASFEQEPVFEEEPKSAATKQPVKPPVPGAAVKPGPAGPAPAGVAAVPPAAAAAVPPVAASVEGNPPLPPAAAAGNLPASGPNVPPASGATASGAPPAPGAPPATVAVKPPAAAPVKRALVQIAAPAEIGIGQQFYTDIKIVDAQDLAGASFVMNYDPKFVEYVSAAEGGFLKKDGKPTQYSATANAATGTVTIKLLRAPNSGGVTGAGTIVSVLFRAKSTGGAGFDFQTVNFTSVDGKPLELLPFSTAVNVR